MLSVVYIEAVESIIRGLHLWISMSLEMEGKDSSDNAKNISKKKLDPTRIM